MICTASRTIFAEEHEVFRDAVRKFFAAELHPNLDRWEASGIVDRSFWEACGKAGLLCPTIPEAYGGLGLDFRYNTIIDEELAYAISSAGIGLQSDIVAEYILHYGSEELRLHWLPRLVSGEVISALAMTEPSTGSDLKAIRATAIRDGDAFVINGSKTYITNGQNADLIIVVAKTDPGAGAKGISLILVESERAGFSRGRNLDKIGQHGADTSELFFHDVRVPSTNLLGPLGGGFGCLMQELPQERLSIAISAQASAQRAFDEACAFTRHREAFGKPIIDMQHTRFSLGAMKAKLQAGWAHLDWAIARHIGKNLTAAEASAAKLFHTELLWELADAALQMHGGAGYMNDYAIARLWRDARVMRIYGGTSEIMKDVIGRTL